MWNAKRPIYRAVLSLLLLLRAPLSGADSIDNYVRAEMTNQRLPGLALAVKALRLPN